MHNTVDLAKYNNSWYRPGRNILIRISWILINSLFIRAHWNPSSGVRKFFLILFGAKVGKSVVIKPGVHVKYPWNLSIGDNTWIGENVWIDNLVRVSIGNNVCISQGAFILTGNHDYHKQTFDLIVKSIFIEDGVWIGAKSMICPGVICRTHSVLTVASVATKELPPYSICSGNPASVVKQRDIY